LSLSPSLSLQVAAETEGGVGEYSKSLYIKTAEASPGLVTNLTAFAQNHSFVVVTWFLPHRINGLITKFAVKVKHARTGQSVRMLELKAEDIMNGVLPHCNVWVAPFLWYLDAADILSRGTPSPSDVTASSPPITLSAVPPAASWTVPISVGVDQLRPYTAYVFEVSAFTSDGEGQIASTMVRMPESAPEDPPQNLSIGNVTSKSISMSWDPPTITTGRFTYVIYLYGPTGYIYENNTADTRFVITGLSPYTMYTVAVRAKSAGEVGPEVTAPPSAVQDLRAVAEDSVSIRVSWRIPAEPNGPITQYRLQVLFGDTLQQDITIMGEQVGHICVCKFIYLSHHNSVLLRIYFESVMVKKVVEDLSEQLSYLVSDLNPFTEYIFKVTASTPVGEGPASYITEKTSEQVPSSVLDVSYQNISSTSILVSWTPPLHPNGRITHYTVYGLNLHNNKALHWATENTTIFIKPLRTYANYHVKVQAHTRVGPGNYSSEVLNVTTLEDESSDAPQNVSLANVTSSSVTLSWYPPSESNGSIVHYTIYYSNHMTEQVRHGIYSKHHRHLADAVISIPVSTLPAPASPDSPFSYTLTGLTGGTSYTVWMTSSTSQGGEGVRSEPQTLITLEDEPSGPPQNVSFANVTSSSVTLLWHPPSEPNGVIEHYTIYYSDHITVTEQVRYLGCKTNILSSAYPPEPSGPPQNVSFANVTSSSVTLLWHPPSEPNGVIEHYTIYYSDNTTRLPVSTLPAPASPDSPFSYTLTGLTGGTNYTIWMTSSTSQGDGGVRSEPQTLITLDNVPGGPVRNLSFQMYGSTAIVVSWKPPLEPNGQLYYLLTLQEAGIPPSPPGLSSRPPAVNKTIETTTTENVYLFVKLRTYFPYVVTVTPATGAGPAYNHTSTLHLRTDEVPSAPVLVSTRNVSSTSIAVVWQPPLEANGEITEYTLTLFGPEDSNTTRSLNTSFIFTNLLPYTPYNLTITAATRKGSGPALLLLLHTDEAGPMSPPRNLTIYNHTAFSVWLSWEPSLEPSGVVTHYGFRIRELIRVTLYPHTDTYTHNSSGPSTTAHLSGFRPSSDYEISVCSYTRAGHGDQFSRPVTFTTNESVADAVGNLSCTGVSWDSIQLLWDLPANPNGQINYYQIVVGSDSQNYTHQAYTPEYTVTGLSPSQEYTMTVTAVNSAGPGDQINCTASTHPESVPGAPRLLTISQVTPDSVTLNWAPPLSTPGLLKEYHITAQMLSTTCEADIPNAAEPPLTKYRYYRFRLAALTNAGVGEYTSWIYIRTLAGNPDAPPHSLHIIPTSNSLRIQWEAPAVLSGPTSYLVHVTSLDDAALNHSVVRAPGELKDVIVTNLTAFTTYSVMVTAFTGPLENATRDGKASNITLIQTLEEKPRDPPKNVTLEIIPEEVTHVLMKFTPPEEPNGNISSYLVQIYHQGQLVMTISHLNITKKQNNTLTAVINGLKGGQNYSIRIAAVNGAGKSPPSPEVQITTGIKAPAKPTQRPQAVIGHGGVAVVTHRSITIRMPVCFYSDHNGPIRNIQVIVAESGVKDGKNLTNWKNAFFHHPAPYLTDEGFPNPNCPKDREMQKAETYVIGANDDCMEQNNTRHLCNGPLKANTVYVFKFRATNILGQYTDSEYSEHVKTCQNAASELVKFCLCLLILLIHQRKTEGGTYSPREAEIIETKYKLDQLINVADLELKEEKLNRPVNKKSFLQHVEDLCANENAQFHEEFADLPKLLHDLSTSDADLPWNQSKNRFTNIKPYNNNRVKLLSEPGMPGSDYINASFISGYLCPNEFIATQGPLPGTVADFWRMIWETGTRTIAMLTQCYEKGRIRCHQYWPEDNKPVTVFGDIIITKLTEDCYPDWTVRALKVERHGDYMVVHHFNYTSWPEHGVPQSSSTLIQFVKAIRANRNENTTIVVHCSAGVGRTGVFIALDHLIQHVSDHDFVDIYGLVAELRSERMCMVQNLAQYMFLHQSTLELLSCKGNSQSIWFVNYSALDKMDSLDAMEGDVELEWEETTM
uniref:Protein tyrosine phosphatase receptor type Q n=1 Tax=Myripristis murdjan TaxID=586833 RepID=A0A667YVN6_9TELE